MTMYEYNTNKKYFLYIYTSWFHGPPEVCCPPPPHMQTTAVVCGVVVLELGTSIIAIVY